MIEMVRIVRNGNGVMVTIPRAMLRFLGWLPGESVVMMVNEDRSVTMMRVRREDLIAQRKLALEAPQPVEVTE